MHEETNIEEFCKAIFSGKGVDLPKAKYTEERDDKINKEEKKEQVEQKALVVVVHLIKDLLISNPGHKEWNY